MTMKKNPYVYNHIISTIRHRTEHGFKRNKLWIIEHMEIYFSILLCNFTFTIYVTAEGFYSNRIVYFAF